MSGSTPQISLAMDRDGFATLVAKIVHEILEQQQGDTARIGTRLAYPEAEAAALLGLASHQLRDARLRGELTYSRGPGRRVLYSGEDLRQYLASRRGG